MAKLRRWRNRILAIVALVIACQTGVSVLARTRRVHSYLIAHLERTFGRPVEVARFDVRILPRPGLDANGVTVGEDPAFGYEYFLRAERLSASLRWTGLLRGHFEFGTLSLSRPSLILVRNGDGKWNLERWLPPVTGSAAANSTARIYGPPPPAAPVNRLQKIEIDDGRINFKNAEDKAPFAFTNVSGSVEQISPGRWQLLLQAQPWRSGVKLQSTGTVQVRGDLAGTSARLQPAEFSVHWGEVSLADLFRLLLGEDYGVRGIFALDAAARSGASSLKGSANAGNNAVTAAPSGEWIFSLQTKAARIHRWDLLERPDNPRVNASFKGRWNPTAGSASAEELTLETPKSNLRGTASLSRGAPGMEFHLDSAGIQAADLLAWYRAFHAGVAEGTTAEQYFTGILSLRGWPLELEEAAFSSRGGEIKLPGLAEPIRIGAVHGGAEGTALIIEPVRISFTGKSGAVATPAKSPMLVSKRGAAAEIQNAADLAFSHDFETHEGAVSINGRSDNIENVLKITAAFGRPINHGWELTGAANAKLRWEWKERLLLGLWNGRAEITKAQLVAAGLNQPLKFEDAAIEWNGGKRSVKLGKAEGFGANWTGEISEANTADLDTGKAKWKIQLHADHLNAADLDRWVGPRARPNWLQNLLTSLLGETAQSSAASELLRRVNAEGELRVDEVTVERLKLEYVRALGAVRDLKLEVSDSQAQWAGGKVHARARAVFSPRPRYEITGDLDGVNLAQLPPTVRAEQRFGGLASGRVYFQTEGVGREELLQKLTGNGNIHFKNVEFRGWDVNASVADGAPHTGISRWTVGDGAFALRDRNIVVDGLRLESGKEESIVNGTLSFAREADLTIEMANTGKRVAAVTEAQHILKITGPLDEPHVSVTSPAIRQPAD